MRSIIFSSLIATLIAIPHLAFAHVTLETQQAVAGAYYKAVFRVPHGCAGSATTALRIKIPDGVSGAKPQPKAGWQLSTVKAKLAQPIKSESGATITEGVSEVAWKGGKLADDNYDEFAVFVSLPSTPGTTLYFPVVQECEVGVNRWIEIPEAGKTARDYRQPAPSLELIAPPK